MKTRSLYVAADKSMASSFMSMADGRIVLLIALGRVPISDAAVDGFIAHTRESRENIGVATRTVVYASSQVMSAQQRAAIAEKTAALMPANEPALVCVLTQSAAAALAIKALNALNVLFKRRELHNAFRPEKIAEGLAWLKIEDGGDVRTCMAGLMREVQYPAAVIAPIEPEPPARTAG